MDRMKSFWTKKYNQNIAKMIGVCYRYVPVREIAEDIAHDAFLTAIEKADTFKGTGSFEGWLRRITVNKALAYLNEQGRTVELAEDVADLEMETEEASADDMMNAIRKADFSQQEIMEAIAQLPEHHRTVLNLYVFDRYTHPQIAELLGINVNTSKSHLLRARRHLQEILFEKSKQKRHLLMFMFPLINNTDEIFDGFCRRQMSGFAIAPTRPLNIAATRILPQPSLRVWLQAHTLPIVATGLATAAIGGLLWTAHPRPARPGTAPADTPSTPPVAADSLATASQDTLSMQYPETNDVVTSAPVPVAASPKAVRPMSAAVETTAKQLDTTATTAEPQTPVIVKKVHRKHKSTVIVKDN